MADLLDTGTDLLYTGEGGSTGDNDKVAVDALSAAGYLKDVLVSDSDLVTLVNTGGQLRVQVNTELSYDPKLTTMDESQIDGATSNYGSYALQSGYSAPVWGDKSFTSYQWMNAQVYQMTRIASSQGTVTKCNLALCGTLSFSSPPACFNVGIFDLDGNLLGQTGLRLLGTDFDSDEELVSVDVTEESRGSLALKRNTRYIIQLWSCGLQFAGLDKSENYNYTYDYNLRQNLQGSVSQPVFPAISELSSRASVIPCVSFGAAALN